MKEFPSIEYKDKTYYQVGCVECGSGDHWKIYCDGVKFIARCGCGNIKPIPPEELKKEPKEQAIDMRLVT